MVLQENIIRIPILPHLKKVILKQFDNVTPVRAEVSTILGKQLQSLINRNEKIRPISEKYNEVLEVELPLDISERAIRLSQLIRINHYYTTLFLDLMILFVEAQRMAGVPAFPALKNFLKFYNINESEYSLENAHRQWQRYLERKYKKEKAKSIVKV